MNPFLRLPSFAAAVVALAASPLLAQKPDPAKEEEIAKKVQTDPFTEGEEKAMKALGIVGYGPMPWADGLRTPDLEKVLGPGRIRWLETAHFRIGCTLEAVPMPDEPEVRKIMLGELQRLRKRWSKLPDRTSKIEPWVRAHIYAQRCEELYEDFAKLVGHDPKANDFLGQRDKFPVLLLQKKSDAARYLDTFCGRKGDGPMRHYFGKTQQNGLVIPAEREEVRDEPSVNCTFRFTLLQTFFDARGGAPYWLSVGVSHWYERQVPANVITCAVRDDESVDVLSQHKWREKMRARAPREALCMPFLQLCKETDLGYYGHVQAWSRVDHLIAIDRAKFTQFVGAIKSGASAAAQEQLLQQVYEMDGPTWDAKWRDWVAKTYK